MGQFHDCAAGFLNNLPDANVTATTEQIGSFLNDADVRREPSEGGRSVKELLAILRRAAEVDLNGASGRAFAAIPGTGLVTSAAASFLAQVMNNYTGLSSVGPGFVSLETDVIRWAARLMGLPDSSAGTITSGGSVSILSAMVVARSKMLGRDFSRGIVYCTQQTHFALEKALQITGFPSEAIRHIPVDQDMCMSEEELRRSIREDRNAGNVPFCIAANAGTTSFGTVDRVDRLADIARECGLWLHVDAAYGGFFQLTERGKRRLEGIERADSIVLDTHKSLFLPNSSSIFLVRDGKDLDDGFGIPSAPFLKHTQHAIPGGEALLSFANLSIELTRPARGIAIWFPLHCHGLGAFRLALDEKLDLTQYLWHELRNMDAVEVAPAPHLSVLAFRVLLRNNVDADNKLTKLVVDQVNSQRDFLISTTSHDEKIFARIAIMSARTTVSVAEELLDRIRTSLSSLV
jgi:aromatic-L-amino-acid decarboxylase